MKLQLSQIKPSPKPIRSSWDAAKMDELKWSLMEEGQVEPIGVHENGQGHYIIVWGHRRVEAARRAGWTEIEGVVVPQDEVNNLIQAGIENLAGEDMTADDKAEWAYRLIELGVSQSEIARRSTVKQQTISQWIIYKREKEGGVTFKGSTKDDEGVAKTVFVAEILKDDLEAKKAVAGKVSEEQLSQAQTYAVAQAYRDAPTPAVKAQVLKTPIISRDTSADILRRSIHRVEMEGGIASQTETNEWQKERDERRSMENWDFAVKEFLDMTRAYAEVARKGTALVKYGKYSPEAARFAIAKIDNLIGILKTYREELEQVE